ncbi:MAG: hypothetical protein O7E51_11120 [Acidobacteria bacterium]|nr:hypothetical protein [Acidobacteriota bacterium]
MAQAPSIIILPVENQGRELDAKILLACVAAERGFPVLIGSRSYIHFQAASVPRGVYLAKSMKTRSIRMFGILCQLGHEIVAWDEEGLLREPDPVYHRWRLSSVAMSRIAHLIAWGEDNARAFRGYSGYHGAPIHVIGNSRIDLLRPELREFYRVEAKSIRERLGEFILINTNFSKVNHFYPALGELKRAAENRKPGQAEFYDAGKGRHKLALFEHFRKMLPAFCNAFADHTVVLRVHPSENPAPWREIARCCPNLSVESEGTIHPWLMATKAVVANGCTTLVESSVLGTPAVNYEPEAVDEYDFELPRSVSHRAASVDELIMTVRALVDGKMGPLDYSIRKTALDPHIAALEGPLAADRIIDVLEQAGYGRSRPPAPPLLDRTRGWLKNKIRTMQRRVTMHKPGYRNNMTYHDHRYPGITVEEMRVRIARFGGLLHRFHGIRVKRHSKHLFWIHC